MIKITDKSIDEVCSEISALINFDLLADRLGTSAEVASAEFQMALAEARQTLSLLENFELFF